MIRRLAYAALATASIPLILGPQHACAAIAAPAAETIQMEHISVEVAGKGSPVILIPGLSSPRAVWDGVAPGLAKNHTVYLVQLNGFGGTDATGNLQPGILDGVVADLHQLITERNLEGVAVGGHSMGGLLTLMLAKAHPGDVGKALIVDALPFVGSAFFPGSTVASVQPQAAAIRDQMAATYGKPADPAAAQAIAAGQALKPESRATVAGWMTGADPRVTGESLYEDLGTDLRPDMAKVTAPVTVIVPWVPARGEQATLDFYRNEYAGTPKLTLVGIGDSGHFVMLDQPEAFSKALDAFLAS